MPMKDREASHCRTCAQSVIGIHLKTTSGGCQRGTVTVVRKGQGSVTGGARHAVASTSGGIRTQSW